MNRSLVARADAYLSGEQGTVFKDPGGRISICLIYPNIYRVGMANLGFQGIYGLLNKRDDVVCERAFLPDEQDMALHIRTGTPLFSLESKRSVTAFDIAAFSIPFEIDYPNILRILDCAKIPFLSVRRDRFHPLLIAGGVCPSFNPEPIAPVFDLMFIGDGEESLDEFLEKYKTAMNTAGGKEAVKRASVSIEGVYVPDYYTVQYNNDGTLAGRTPLHGATATIRRRCLGELSSASVTTSIISSESEFSNMYLIEAMRGCPWSCRFCLVGHLYRPVRKKEISVVKDEIGRAGQLQGEGRLKIGLIGPSLTDYAYAKEVLGIRGVDFSITSLRAGAKSAELVELLKRHKSISIAPEAGTERMRTVINKKISENDILETSARVLEAGVDTLRLYFMIGLPTETEEDISGIVALTRKIRQTSKKGMLVLSVSTFVPKPLTPFQWHGMEPLSAVKEKLKFIKKELRDEGSIKVFHDVPKYAHLQGLFARGDRRVFKVIEAMTKTEDMKKACSEAGIDMAFYVFRKRDFQEILPWDFIEADIPKERLWGEYSEALST
ncbi:MAG: radical SAM protein [Dissulfurispiraceae bacterium]|jgi:radical SAM superfamily enzyme YgiQ (UPF0313 family)